MCVRGVMRRSTVGVLKLLPTPVENVRWDPVATRLVRHLSQVEAAGWGSGSYTAVRMS